MPLMQVVNKNLHLPQIALSPHLLNPDYSQSTSTLSHRMKTRKHAEKRLKVLAGTEKKTRRQIRRKNTNDKIW